MLIEEIQYKMRNFAISYFLTDMKDDKKVFYSFSQKEISENYVLTSGYVMNLFMDGLLEKANEFINNLPDQNLMKQALTIVNPTVSFRSFIKNINDLKAKNAFMGRTILTAGRPYLLNGFSDFTRLGPFLLKNRDIIIEDIEFLYGSDCSEQIYNLCLAEYYYQTGNLLEAELVVSRTIKTFNTQNQFRFLFSALFLQAKIAFANGTITKSSSFIKEIKEQVTNLGKAEFSSNIEASEVHLSFYNSNYQLITNWIKTDAPDETGDFNMLDLYRYMIKIRCYIIQEEYSAAISLIEKIRPLLEVTHRFMDLCELDLLLSEVLWACGKKNLAMESLDRSIKIARRRNYVRLVADEGAAIFEILVEYLKQKGESKFLNNLVEVTRRMAIMYPLYLKPRIKNKESFTQQEVDFLNLLQQGKDYEEIADYFFISVNTVKYHIKKIYSKLDCNNANKAVWNAKLLGLIK